MAAKAKRALKTIELRQRLLLEGLLVRMVNLW